MTIEQARENLEAATDFRLASKDSNLELWRSGKPNKYIAFRAYANYVEFGTGVSRFGPGALRAIADYHEAFTAECTRKEGGE